MPFWPFRQLTYGKHLLFVTVDAGHVQKAIARAGRTHIRKIQLGSFWAPRPSRLQGFSNVSLCQIFGIFS